jgi:hypothetical protein
MAIQVRLFSHSGISHAFVANYSAQKSFTALPLLKQPYLARENLTVDTGAAVSSTTALAPANSHILLVQVPPGSRVHYEVNRPGRDGGAVTADTSSPIIEGDEHLEWEPGCAISLLQVS